MMKKIKISTPVLFFVLSFFAIGNYVIAADIEKPKDNFGADTVKYNEDKSSNINDFIKRIATFILGFIGALSVLIIIIGGIFYIISGGDAGKTETAKGWVLYAVVGLIVALLGWVIVNTVITGLQGTGSSASNSTSNSSTAATGSN